MTREHKGAIPEIAERPWAFAFAFLMIFGVSLGFLAFVGATPDPVSAASAEPAQTNTPAATSTPELPVRVIAKDIGLDVSVSNPTTTDVNALDQNLLSGAVRYPTTSLLGETGTVVIFGHSSYLPIVHNQAYKTFDGIQNLKPGNIISVYSSDLEYRYTVTSVKVADATQDVIDLPSSGEHLTLVTCDSFASKTNRFIVMADFVGTYALGK